MRLQVSFFYGFSPDFVFGPAPWSVHPCPFGCPSSLLRQQSSARERKGPEQRRSSTRQKKQHRARAGKAPAAQQQRPRSAEGAAAAPSKKTKRKIRAPVAAVAGKEEQEKRNGPGLGTFSTSPDSGLYGGSTIDLTAGSTIDLGASSSVDLEETSREQGLLPVRATAATVRGDRRFLGTNRDDTANTVSGRNGSDEVPCDLMQDYGPRSQPGPVATRAGVPENDPDEGGQEKGRGGGKGDDGYGVENLARSDPTGAAGGTTGTIQSCTPNLEQMGARTNSSGGRRRVSVVKVGDDGNDGGVGCQQEGHRQQAFQHKGSSTRPSADEVMGPSDDGALQKERNLRDAVLGDTRRVSRSASTIRS